MNLRQKVKLAKCQLVELNRTRGGSSTWDIIQRYEKKFKLEKIIDYKRKPSRIYHWNEKYTIDLSNLTYISIHVDFLKIATLKSHNGKPLKLSEINNFLNKTFKTAVYEYATGVSKIKYDDTKKRKHIDYCLFISNCRTKSKKKHIEKVYYQFEGDDVLYAYETDKAKFKE
ncbi:MULTISPECIES: hypothetical protein [unclassified Psychrobacillus]|uniref:hypothetical protein n=1 Tax=unclassified Psychrobacillus TaxID=2636677 RepID=UPI0030FA7B5A